jgi:predicted GNAT superfamily acetyltransferase
MKPAMATPLPGSPGLRSAAEHALGAARAAQVTIRTLNTPDDVDQARDLWDQTWSTAGAGTEITAALTRAISHAGGYVAGAYHHDQLLAACLAFPGRCQNPDGTWTTYLHADTLAVQPAFADRGIGTAVMLHQRAWAIERGLDHIRWTFDPLARRNARVNLHKLAGVGEEYLVNFYGVMNDAQNAGQPSDRLLVRWDLNSPAVASAVDRPTPGLARRDLLDLGAHDVLLPTPSGAPQLLPGHAELTLIAVPADIVTLRRTDLGLAQSWQVATREAFAPMIAGSADLAGITRDGHYILRRRP